MGNTSSLQSIYQKHLYASDSHSYLEAETQALLEGRFVNLTAALDAQPSWAPHTSEERILGNWKDLLVLTLLGYFSHANSKELVAQVRFLARESGNENSQYLRILIALNYYLVGLPVPEVYPQLLQGGAAPIDIQEYCPWQALPYLPYHTEFGTLLCVLNLLTASDDLRPLIERLAAWQLNTLNYDFLPLAGLFVREKDGAYSHNLMWTYLLFYGAAQLTGERKFQTVADAQLRHLNQLADKKAFTVPTLLVLLEKVLQKASYVEKEPFKLVEQIYDPSTALIGKRFESYGAVCTLHGGHTGLGCFRVEDVEIVNYGPQYLPLGDCLGFGIEGNHLSDHGLRQSNLKIKQQGFSLKGCVRLVDQPPPAYSSPFHFGEFRGIWFEIEQELKDRQLSVQTNFLGFDGWESVAFSFFIKAEKCLVNSKTLLMPKTFNRYEGGVQPLVLEGKKASFKLQASFSSGTMQVIPLGGGDSFWGADFLVAYLLDINQHRYAWQITS